MARAKRTDRAEARRRYRAEVAEVVDVNGDDAADEEGAPERPVAEPRGRRPAPNTRAGATPRMGLVAAFRLSYQVANVPSDLRALPTLLLGRSFLIPGALTLASVLIAIVSLNSPNVIASLVVTLFLGPLPIGSIYAAGVLAPRASSLMGALAAFMGTIGLIVVVLIGATTTPGATDVLYALVFYTVFGAVIGAGLGFYRRLLRNMNPTPNRPVSKAKAGARSR